MDLGATLLSPLWWASVAGAGAVFAALGSLVLRQTPRPAREPASLLRALRLRAWLADLLILANLATMGVLLLGSFRVPSPTGPLGLALAFTGVSSIALAWQVHLAVWRIEARQATPRPPARSLRPPPPPPS